MARTSLERIQTLEKDYPTFSEQLTAVSEIAGLHLDLLTTDFSADLIEAIERPLFTGKVDWALKWALGRLEAKGPVATSARSCPAIWNLVGNLVSRVSISCLRSSFRGSRLVFVLDSTLEENFSEYEESAQSTGTRLSVDEENTRSPKRRKLESPNDSVSRSMHSQSCTHQLELFDALSRCLATIHFMSNDIPKQQMPVTGLHSSRIGVEQASKLLSNWLRAVNLCLTPQLLEGTKNDVNLQSLHLSLQLVLDIWNERFVDPEQPTLEGPTYFSKHCLVQSVSSLALVEKLLAYVGKVATVPEHLEETVKLIQSLNAKEFILPIRAIFDDEANNTMSAIERFFQPLKISSDTSASKSSQNVPSVSSLFKLAMRVRPLTSPAKRLKEKPWIEALFLTLCDCMSVNFETHFEAAVGSAHMHELQAMFLSMKTFHITVSRRPVEVISWNCLNDVTGEGISAAWALLQSIIAVDPHVFSARNIKREGSIGEPSQYLIDKLMSAANKHQWSKKAASDKPNEQYIFFTSMVSDLIRAFASDRQLDWFLRVWDGQSRTATKDILRKSYLSEDETFQMSIWEDPELVQVLSMVLHTYSSQSWCALLKRYLVTLETIAQPNFSPVEQIHIFSLVPFLKALIFATTQEHVLLMLHDDLAHVVSVCLQALHHHESFPDAYLSYLYQLLDVAHHKWAGLAQYKEFRDTGLDALKTLSSIAFKKVKGLVHTPKDIALVSFLRSIMGIGSIVEQLGKFPTFQPDITGILRPLLKSISEILHESNKSLQFFWKEKVYSAIVVHPMMLDALKVTLDDRSDAVVDQFLKVDELEAIKASKSSTENQAATTEQPVTRQKLESSIERCSNGGSGAVPTAQLAKTIYYLLDSLTSASDINSFADASERLRLLLIADFKAVDQSNIETILLTVSQLCSSFGPKIGNEYARHIFTRLCRIMRLLLIRHRRKLRGRFDTLAPTLQSLLRCFFSVPENPLTGVKVNNTKLPPWLAANGKSLSQADAQAFTRLITLICSPSLSAVAGPTKGKKAALTDETAEARRYAGRYMHLVLLEFVNCTLARKALQVDVHKELMRGMFVILDITNNDVLNAVNSRLTPLARSRLTDIVSDWNRHGKGWEV